MRVESSSPLRGYLSLALNQSISHIVALAKPYPNETFSSSKTNIQHAHEDCRTTCLTLSLTSSTAVFSRARVSLPPFSIAFTLSPFAPSSFAAAFAVGFGMFGIVGHDRVVDLGIHRLDNSIDEVAEVLKGSLLLLAMKPSHSNSLSPVSG